METQVPAEIDAIIERKRFELMEQKAAKDEAEQRKHQEAQTRGREIYKEYMEQSLLEAPEWIRPYHNTAVEEPDYWRLANGWDRAENIALYFSIPGLAMIEFNPKMNNWRSQIAGWNTDYDDSEPYIRFNSQYKDDLEFVLGVAEEQLRKYEEYMNQYAAKHIELMQRREAYLLKERELEADAREADLRSELNQQAQQAEEQLLLEILKSDSVAMAMLKAFVMIHQERNIFTAQIEDANNNLYSMEEHWSHKAVELRRQADDAQRRAEEEKYRLENDLYDAETKLKKAQKEQRSW